MIEYIILCDKMNYSLLVKKLNGDKRYVSRDLIKKYSNSLGIPYSDSIAYLTRNNYLYTILRGVFYNPTIEERKLKRMNVNHREAISEALSKKGVTNWYFGLESALKMNNLTHEFYTLDTIINDSIFRENPIKVLGNKIRFIKVKPDLFGFGTIDLRGCKYSDKEKTVLDIIYLDKYNGKSDDEIKDRISPFIPYCSIPKLLEYSKNYNRSVEIFIEGL
ncbi:MAG: hypothetical protein APG12_01662 [Candidatus Methanofastidiosum methylothiophilum]|uniref:AbiEi antitoxin C-terminal domain-containing protein n=1 Tax=Candidatus Methanofastidiosum methylothiophilum TaxID=1705564 RepID=A0A150IVX6_9EURY|nr:MAG: hypothetical protein APG10_01676 [Candidatus Methanofastidiosum methylthiophilus]KYC46693.1 MAG: hypothetical protein APG11_01735 [Candidatus Methanofastidiosum methylthiophilus]KYC49133.1 MAG: hypothetical protein APG12_01662 [Candidatus Methanofastidiosum methylthiophilus]